MATALITGASGGIGYELANVFAKNHYNLVLVARSKERLEFAQKELTTTYPITVTIIAKDLSLPAAAKELYDETTAQKIPIDILVNNAGFGISGSFAATTIEEQTALLELNIVALTKLTHYYLKDMLARNSGKILNVASIAAFQPGPGMATYYASKSYVLSLTSALHHELRKTGVSVTALCPGPTKTGFGTRAGITNSRLFAHAVDAAYVAQKAFDGLMKKKRIVIPGALSTITARAAPFLPTSSTMHIVDKLHESP